MGVIVAPCTTTEEQIIYNLFINNIYPIQQLKLLNYKSSQLISLWNIIKDEYKKNPIKNNT